MEKLRQKQKEWTAIAVCLCALLMVFVLWAADNPITTWQEWVIVLCDTVLFCVIGIQFIFRWFDAWRTPELEAPTARVNWRTDAAIFCGLLLVHALRILIAYLWQSLALGFTGSIVDSLDGWYGSDTRHYLGIAEHWYEDFEGIGTVWRLVFLPFYSILIRLLHTVVRDWFLSGMLVSILCSSAAGCVLYRLALLDYDRETAQRALKYYVILPTALFYTAALSEGTFMLLSLLCVYAVRKKNWLTACIAGGLAAFTRSVGIILLVPVCFEWLTELISGNPILRRRTLLWGLSLLLIPLGFGAYLFINYAETGDWFRFTVYQRENWDQHLGWFFSSVRYQLNYLIEWFAAGKRNDAIGLWMSSLLAQFGALGLMAITARRQRASYVAYFLIYFMVTMGASWLLSAPRYLLVLFPLLFAMADLSKKRSVDATFTAGCLVLGQLYLYAFLNRCDVY